MNDIVLPNNKFCILPWISLEVTPNFTFKPCSLAIDEVSDNGVIYNLDNNGIAEIQNCNYMESLRQDFLKGKEPKTCRKCFENEKLSKPSKRQESLDQFKQCFDEYYTWNNNAKELISLGLQIEDINNVKDEFWRELEFLSNDLRHIEFRSTNVLLMERHYQFLQHLINKGHSKQIEIKYSGIERSVNTNYDKVWKQFKAVEFADKKNLECVA